MNYIFIFAMLYTFACVTQKNPSQCIVKCEHYICVYFIVSRYLNTMDQYLHSCKNNQKIGASIVR